MQCAILAPMQAEDWVLAPMREGPPGIHPQDMNEFTRADWLRWASVTVGVATVAVPLSFLLWRTPPGAATPPAGILPALFPIAMIIPALSFGWGVAFMLFGRKLMNSSQPSTLSRAAFVSIVWLLTNWWPHSNFHRVSNGWTNLLVVDYFFHTTVIVASCVIAAFFLTVIRERQRAGQIQGSAHDFAPAPTE